MSDDTWPELRAVVLPAGLTITDAARVQFLEAFDQGPGDVISALCGLSIQLFEAVAKLESRLVDTESRLTALESDHSTELESKWR